MAAPDAAWRASGNDPGVSDPQADRHAVELAEHLLFQEVACLDEQRWDDWLELFCADCEYWVPSWKDEHEPTEDPRRELSLIYYRNRAGLEDRVWRVRSHRSVASSPLPRTHHVVTNVRASREAGSRCLRGRSNWTVHQFRLKSRDVELMFGRYEHEWIEDGESWKIRRRKALLLNDLMPAMLDFYSL